MGETNKLACRLACVCAAGGVSDSLSADRKAPGKNPGGLFASRG